MVFEVIGVCEKESILEAEQFWINALDTYKTGFNRCPDARNSLGIKRSEETLQKMRKTENYKKANAVWSGSKHTEETRAVIRAKRATQVMVPWTEERKASHTKLMQDVAKRIVRDPAQHSKYFNITADNGIEKLVFSTTHDAAKHFKASNTLGIARAIRGERKTYRGYRWSVEGPNKIE